MLIIRSLIHIITSNSLYNNKSKKSICLPKGQLDQCEALYIINSAGIAYHQLRKKLYIIIAKGF